MRRLLPLLAALLLLSPLAALAGEDSAARHEAEAKLEALAKDDAAAAYRLGASLEQQGFEDLAKKAYEIVVAIEPEHRAARRALGFELVGDRWVRGDDAFRAKGFVRHQNRWMTAEEFAQATRPQREAAEQKAGESEVLGLLAMVATEDAAKVAAARRRMATVEDRFKLAPLAKALRCKPTSLRVYAAEELARLADPLAVPALLKRAVYDPDPEARKAVAAALREIGEPGTVQPLARALDSRYADVRVRAAEALGQLADEQALGIVIKKWEARSGNFPAVYFAQVQQVSYIQDFDVEVAQTSFIADPIVGVLQEGVVQAVKVLATEHSFTTVERVAYHDAAARLAGTDLGDDVKAWSKFWTENGERLLRERDERVSARAAARKAR
jgi:hypothetical protein